MAANSRYATVAELQAYIQAGGTYTATEDIHHAAVLDMASRMIDRETRRFFGTSADATAKVFTARNATRLVVPDLVSVSALKTDTDQDGTYDRTWASSDYRLFPPNAAGEVGGRPYTEIRVDVRTGSSLYYFPTGSALSVQVTGVWGWPAVPADIKAVCLLEAQRLNMQNQTPSGVIANQQAGTMMILPELHPTSRRVLASYRRMGRIDG